MERYHFKSLYFFIHLKLASVFKHNFTSMCELHKSNINLLKYNINFNRVHSSSKDDETYVTVCSKKFRCSSVGFNKYLNPIFINEYLK